MGMNQHELLEFLREYWEENGNEMLTGEEIAEMVGGRPAAAVRKCNKLYKWGYLERDRRKIEHGRGYIKPYEYCIKDDD